MKTVGAEYQGNGRCRFTVWAPQRKSMTLHLVHPQERELDMDKDSWGYFTLELEGVEPGARYFFKPDGKASYPDPASYLQPEGVHGPSEVIDHGSHTWTDTLWGSIPLQSMVIYELHVGTFTPEGTFEAVIPRLDALRETGINTLELMPVAQFPGNRNWGYDGVYPYAVQNSYGGPEGLKKLVNACHNKGMAVLLDVVYNHLGPEGNYLELYAPYFTDKYKTPWGKAINFDGDYSDGVRNFFTNNPLYWLEHYHIDGLRLDAVHTIFDQSAETVWEVLDQKIRDLASQMERPFHLIAESDLNSPRVVQASEKGGYGFDAQWLDDFHHALYVLLDKEGQKLYKDFGRLEQLAKAYAEGFVHSGQYVKFRKKTFGASSALVPGNRFIAFIQNHDQVGNRVKGERLSTLVGFERLKLAAAALLLAPYIPMLFMGEEYGEEAPFLYFVSHSDQQLIKSVQEGRREEFASYKWQESPPDPQDNDTFQRSKLQWEKRKLGRHQKLLRWHQALLQLRSNHKALQNYNKADVQVRTLGQKALILHRQSHDQTQQLTAILNFSEEEVSYTFPPAAHSWAKILCSTDKEWQAEHSSAGGKVKSKVAGGDAVTVPALGIAIFSL